MKPNVFFTYDDLSTLAFMDVLVDQGWSISEVIAIIGFDDIERGEYAAVPLTTVRQRTGREGGNEIAVEVDAGEAEFCSQSHKAGIDHASVLWRSKKT